jgi:hypothetical protein
MTKAQ